MIHEVNPNNIIFCGIEYKNNRFKRENQIHFYLSGEDSSLKKVKTIFLKNVDPYGQN